MGNKQQLQLNNETLASILSNVLGLPSQESLKHGAYAWKKLTSEGGDFIDFTVSDDPTAYPDGGEHGGYWYEKVSEGITPELFGFTKYAIDKFTPTSDQKDSSTPLSHSLGVEPKFIYMIAIEQPTSTSVTMSYIATEFWATRPDATSFTKSSECKHIVHSAYQGGYVNGDSSVSVTTSTLTFGGDSHFKAGIEYTLITMA